MSADCILETKRLTVRFGGLVAVNDVDIRISRGELVGLIGPNGAGKTTIFNLITGALAPTEGDILFKGQSIVGKRPDQIARLGLSRTFQNIRLFTKASVLENIMIAIQRDPSYSVIEAFLRLPKVKKADREASEKAHEFLELVGLTDYAGARAGSLPYGLQRRLEIARALATGPEFLQLDEPAAGMNNEECASLIELVSRISRQTGISIMLIEHHMDVVMQLCGRVYVLNLGSVLKCGTPDEVQSDPTVIKAYLGERRH